MVKYTIEVDDATDAILSIAVDSGIFASKEDAILCSVLAGIKVQQARPDLLAKVFSSTPIKTSDLSALDDYEYAIAVISAETKAILEEAVNRQLVDSEDDAVEICIHIVYRLGKWLNVWDTKDNIADKLQLISDYDVSFPVDPATIRNMLSYYVNRDKMVEITDDILVKRAEVKEKQKIN